MQSITQHMQAATALQNTICNICMPDSEKVWERGRCIAVYKITDGCIFNDNANLKQIWPLFRTQLL